jgi:hypothetical protein
MKCAFCEIFECGGWQLLYPKTFSAGIGGGGANKNTPSNRNTLWQTLFATRFSTDSAISLYFIALCIK